MRESRLTEETIIQLLNNRRKEIRQWRFQILTVISAISYLFGFFLLSTLFTKNVYFMPIARSIFLFPLLIPSVAWVLLILIPNLTFTSFESRSQDEAIYDEEVDNLRYLIRREALFYKIIDFILILDLVSIASLGFYVSANLFR